MRRGRPPKPVDPNASCAARLGAELRACRMARSLTQQALADLTGYTPQHISEVERARTHASEGFVIVVDAALGADGALVALYPDACVERALATDRRAHARQLAAAAARRQGVIDDALRSVKEVDDVKRRAFIGLGLSVVLLGAEAVARASADDWDRIAHAWSYEIAAAEDRRALLPGLAADLKRLHAYGGPQHVIAQLSAYAATIAISLGGGEERSVKWWRYARQAAHAAGDTHLLAHVDSQQAVQGLYCGSSPQRALILAEEALSATGDPCRGRMGALSAKAQSLAMLGQAGAATNTLRLMERTFERLPRDVTREKLSAMGWAEQRLHHVRSFCSMYGVEGGEAARRNALRLYDGTMWRGATQVQLHRAVVERDPSHAVDVLRALKPSQRDDQFVRRIALDVLERTENADLRELVS